MVGLIASAVAARARRRPALLPVLLALLAAATAQTAAPAAAWTLDLADSCRVGGTEVRLADVALGSVPDPAAEVVLHAGGTPGRWVTLEARAILRRLVALGLAADVRLTGASACRVLLAGAELTPPELVQAVQAAAAPLIPAAAPGAPPSRLEVTVPDRSIPVARAWSVRTSETRPLSPGRNLLPVEVRSGGRVQRLTVEAVLHAYGELPVPRRALAAGTRLDDDDCAWEWVDLAAVRHGVATGRTALRGMSAGRDLAPGQPIRSADLRPTAIVRSGEPVDLRVRRGTVVVAVRATARRDGALGETIPVRNELTGRVITARVTGPGQVDWRN
ncbi:MAG: flagellar basal body P-ring formation chaperone FlgA [Candidatus Krumholzibacteriia bacterium]